MAVTLKDIAREAGVDPSVISSVLNGSKSIRVSVKTRERVLALVESMNYRPNMIARSLCTKKTNTIGVLLYSTRDRFSAAMMAEIETYLRHFEYVAHFTMWESSAEIPGAYNSMISRRVDGIISTQDAPDFMPESIPHVVYGVKSEIYDFMMNDYTFTMRMILDYLVGLGHRRIFYLGCAKNDDRKQIFDAALRERGLDVPPENEIICRGFASDAYQAAKEILSRETLPDAIVAVNDVAAISCISAANDLGIRVPEELSIIGFDNLEESCYCVPKLTTAGFDIREKSRQLVDMLMERMNGRNPAQRRIMIRPELVVRNSCAARSNILSRTGL